MNLYKFKVKLNIMIYELKILFYFHHHHHDDHHHHCNNNKKNNDDIFQLKSNSTDKSLVYYPCS